jgi:hypothetical protein
MAELTTEEQIALLNKIDWEGGVEEYFIHYTSETYEGTDLEAPLKALRKAYKNLNAVISNMRARLIELDLMEDD